eukprot:TRINITY_DN12098_c0_g1_i3.p1 TRINITY_DN12098_c0_g1~~TRINITY_DN12098_c0_g1_i3.p1  ORF type:complete len:324 (-),score=42.20 TRINITY_DN12098_c0_g1_i3:841-1812(-)
MVNIRSAVWLVYLMSLFEISIQENEVSIDGQKQGEDFQKAVREAEEEMNRSLKQLKQGEFQQQSEVLVAVVTANIFFRTRTFFISLAAMDDDFDVLVVDEQSTDGTQNYVKTRKIQFIQSEGLYGVTHNWNLAYKFFTDHQQYNYLFIVNNDILIPNTAIDTQVRTMKNCDCDLITPLSSMKGKGHMAQSQSIEVVYKLHEFSLLFHLDTNYQQVQNYLNKFREQIKAPDQCFFTKVVPQFNGFFFGFKKSSFQKIQINGSTLFDPNNRNVGQEYYIEWKMQEAKQKICLDRAAFVYHYKASTISIDISDNEAREKFVRSSKV